MEENLPEINGTGAASPESAPAQARGVIRGDQGIAVAQVLISGLLVAVGALLVCYNAVNAPFIGTLDDVVVENPDLHSVFTAASRTDLIPGTPLSPVVTALAWQVSGGTASAFRTIALVLLVLFALGLFFLVHEVLKVKNTQLDTPLGAPHLWAAGLALVTAFCCATMFGSGPGPLRGSAFMPYLTGLCCLVWGGLLLFRAGKRARGRLGAFSGVLLLFLGVAASPTILIQFLTFLVLYWCVRAHLHKPLWVGAENTPLYYLFMAWLVVPDFVFRIDSSLSNYDVFPRLFIDRDLRSAALILLLFTGLNFARPRLAGTILAVLVCAGSLFTLALFWQSDIVWEDGHAKEAIPMVNEGYYLERGARAATEETGRVQLAGEALDIYLNLSLTDDATPDFALRLFNTAEMAGRTGEALPVAEAALTRNPHGEKSPELARRIAVARQDTATPGQPPAPAEMEKTLDLLGFALRNGGTSPDIAGRHGMGLLVRGDLEGALPRLEEAAKALPDSPYAQAKKQVENALGMANSLEKAALEAAKNNPNDVNALLARAEREVLLGRLTPALYLAGAGFRRHPEDEKMWRVVGQVKGARGEAEQFMAAHPDAPAERWAGLVNRCADMGLWDAAAAYLPKSGLAGEGTPEEAVAGMAMKRNQPTMARIWLVRAMERHPDAWQPALSLADMALKSGNNGGAAAFLAEAEKRGAPAGPCGELRARLGGNAPAPAPLQPGEEFTPVRTMIQ